MTLCWESHPRHDKYRAAKISYSGWLTIFRQVGSLVFKESHMPSSDEFAMPRPAGRTRRSIIAMAALIGGAAVDGLVLNRPAYAGSGYGGHHHGGGGGGGGGGDDGGGDGGGGHHGGGGGGGGANCLLKGTRIRTPEGERPIEQLNIGDLVVTIGGEAKPIRWIAKRRYVRQPTARWTPDVAPIRIARDALGPGLPSADLFIAASHALYFDGALINVEELVNGATIAPCPPTQFEELAYFHINLADHDVIYAEGAACETLNVRHVERFDNFTEYERLYGRPQAVDVLACAPVLAFDGRRSMILSRLRSAVSPIVDRRTQLDRLRDLVEERALEAA
jgi:hypothetical protein